MDQVSDVKRPITVTGLIMGMYADDDTPFCLRLEGVNFLVLFSTIEKFRECVAFSQPASSPFEVRPKLITDGPDFLDSVKGIRLMLDPWITQRGTTRFTEVTPP